MADLRKKGIFLVICSSQYNSIVNWMPKEETELFKKKSEMTTVVLAAQDVWDLGNFVSP